MFVAVNVTKTGKGTLGFSFAVKRQDTVRKIEREIRKKMKEEFECNFKEVIKVEYKIIGEFNYQK